VSRRVFRLAGSEESWPMTEKLLLAQGYAFSPAPFYQGARLLDHEPLPLGASLAARFGYIYIQDASSMLPALALNRLRKPGQDPNPSPTLALDLCASPGGKTSLLARLLGHTAMVLGNEPAPKRLGVLRNNLRLLNIFNAASLGCPGEALPLVRENFDLVLLDPPCSGWGTAEKHPKVLDIWQGSKLKPLVSLQKRLLRAALDLLRPGGLLLYSTCTLNIQENEEQIAWALDNIPGLTSLPLESFPGFSFEAPAPCAPESLRITSGGQGFYLAALGKAKKPGVAPPPLPGSDLSTGLSPSGLAAPLLDPSLLPPGWIESRPDGLYFQHAAGTKLRPLDPYNARSGDPRAQSGGTQGRRTRKNAPDDSPPWQGFFIGKRGAGPRDLLPPPTLALQNRAAVLQAENLAPLLALVSGQSLPGFAGEKEAGLYYRDLPLGRLKCRNGRVFL